MIVDCAAYRHGARQGGRLGVADAAPARTEPDTFVWLGLRDATGGELTEAFRALGFDESSVDEVLRAHERPVLAVDGDATRLVLRTAKYSSGEEALALGEVSVLAGPDAVISVRHGQASPLSGLRQELERHDGYLALGPPAVLAAVIRQVVHDYQTVLDGFERSAVEADAEVFGGGGATTAARVHGLRRELRHLLVVVESLQDPLARLLRQARGRWPERVVASVEEAADQLVRTVSRARSLSEVLGSAMVANLAMVSVHQQRDLRRAAAWAAIVAVPLVVAALWGMPFTHRPDLHAAVGWPVAFVVVALLCWWLHRRFRALEWL